MSNFVLGEATVQIESKGFDKFQREVANTEKQLKLVGKEADATSTAFARAGRQNAGVFRDVNGKLRNTRGQFVAMGRSAEIAGRKSVRGFAALRGSIGSVTGAMGGLTVATAGATAGFAALAGAGALLAKSVRVAADLETRLAEVATISDEVAGNMKGFADQIGKLSVSTRTDSGLLGEGLYQTISSGITDANEALKVTEVAANTARAGLTDVGTAVSGLTSALNAYGLESSAVTDVSDKFFTTVRAGKLRMGELASAFGNIAPIAATLGVGLDELLASGAALTLSGQSISESFTQVRSILTAVLKPTKEAAELAEELGLDFSATALRTKGLTGFIEELKRATGGSEEQMATLVGRVEGITGVFALAGNQADDFNRILDEMRNSAGATDRAVGIMNKTFDAQVKLLKTQLSETLRMIGDAILPHATEAVQNLNTALQNVDWNQFRSDVNATVDALAKVAVVTGKIGIKLAKLDFKKRAGIFGVALAAVDARRNEVGGDTSVGAFRAFEASTSPRGDTSAGAFRALEADIASKETSVGAFRMLDAVNMFGAGITSTIKPLKELGETVKETSKALIATTEEQKKLLASVAPDVTSLRTTLTKRGVQPISTDARGATRRENIVFGRGKVGSTTGGFVAPTGDPTLSNITPTARNPVEILQGGLPLPALDIAKPTPKSVTEGLTETAKDLSAIGDTTKQVQNFVGVEGTKSAGIARAFLDEAKQSDRELGIDTSYKKGELLPSKLPVAVPQAFDRGFETVAGLGKDIGTGGETTGPGFGSMIAEEGKKLSEGFSLVGSAIEGAATGGLPGALIAVGTEILSMTEGFGRVQTGFNDLVGSLVEAIDPLISVLADILVPVFKVIGKVLTAVLKPAFEFLGKAIKGLANLWVKMANFWIRLANSVIGLINKIPGINIGKISQISSGVFDDRASVTPDSTLAAERAEAQRTNATTTQDTRTSGGFRVSNITGPTRDMFVDLLKPLRQLDNVMPAMLEELRNIREVLTPGHRPPSQSAIGGVASLRSGFAMREDFPRAPVLQAGGGPNTGLAEGRGTTIINIDNITVNVENATDLDAEVLQRTLRENLRGEFRDQGEVFQDNDRNNRFRVP